MISEQNILQDEKAMSAKQACIPVGFKLTEVGTIPEEWNICHLEDLGTSSSPAIKAGPFGSSLTKSIYVKSGYKVYGQEQVIKGNHEYGDYFINENKFRQLKSCEVIENDILLSLVGTAGKLLVIPKNSEKGIINPRLLRFRFNKEKIDSVFFKFLFEDRAIQELLAANAQGGTMAVLNASILKRLKIPLPALKEQKAIASVLSATDELINKLEQLIFKKKAIKTATMQQMLTGRIRLPQFAKHPDGTLKGYRPSELGSIPEDWQVVSFKDVLTIKHGKNQKKVESPSGQYPIYATGGQIGNATSFLFDKPSVLIGRKGTIDKPRYADTPFWTVDTLFYSEIKKNACVKFIYYKFCMIDWMQYNEASGVPSLNAHTIENVFVVLPNMEEQTAIATILSDMDAELTALERKLVKVRDIKQGMMQQLLTGRIRLPLDQQP